jgi:hypothetical protein
MIFKRNNFKRVRVIKLSDLNKKSFVGVKVLKCPIVGKSM